jgi:glycosyltransferase involved in cell wall biosynthesis
MVLRRTQGVIVLGEKLRSLFIDYFNDERVFVVPNGADYNFEQSKKEKDKFAVCYLGTIHDSKGVTDIIAAVDLLVKEDIVGNFQLDVVGSWFDEKLKIKCNELYAAKNLPVIFHPEATDTKKLDFYLNADIFIFPPRDPEGHPWVIVEAMAAGLPIISTDQGAITESVIDGINGFIVEKQNPSQIAEKIKLLIENTDLRIKMGKESRRLYEENYTEEKMVERLTQAFNAVLNG